MPNYPSYQSRNHSKLASESLDKRILRELDALQNQVKRLKGEIYYLKYGISREEEFYKKLIDSKQAVMISVGSEEPISATIIEHLRYCLHVKVWGNSRLIQKSNIKYIEFTQF